MRKQYLGDSVYVELNNFGQVVLTTDNGYGPSNVICLEPEVLWALDLWLKSSKPNTAAEIGKDLYRVTNE